MNSWFKSWCHNLLSGWVLLCALTFFCPFRSMAQAVNDNVPSVETGIGSQLGSSVETNFEEINLSTGEVSMFIPAVTLKQRAGSKPLTLGFTYNSTQMYVRQEVTPTIMQSWGPIDITGYQIICSFMHCFDASAANPPGGDSYRPANNVTGLQEPTGVMYYDSYDYSIGPTYTNPFGTHPVRVNLPVLQASVEYEGDAWVKTLPFHQSFPVVCVTNFTFTDWAGHTHPFALPYPAASECNSETYGFTNSGAGFVVLVSESSDSSFYRLDLSNLADITVTDSDGTVYHFTGGHCERPMFPDAKKSGLYSTPKGGHTQSCGVQDIPSSIVDRNGNTITISNAEKVFVGGNVTITDTLGRRIAVQAFPDYNDPASPKPMGFSYQNSNGTTQSVLISEISSTEQPVPDVGPPVDYYEYKGHPTGCYVNARTGDPPYYAQYNISVFQGVAANSKNGWLTEYQLKYGDTGKIFTFWFDSFNHLKEIRYPTGGYRKYDYQDFEYNLGQEGILCNWGAVRAVAKYECSSSSGSCSSEDKTSYDYNPKPGRSSLCVGGNDLGGAAAAFVTVTDPFGTETVHCFDRFSETSPFETNTYIYDKTGKQIKSVAFDYSEPDRGSANPGAAFLFPSQVTTTIGAGKAKFTSKILYSYPSVQETVVGLDTGLGPGYISGPYSYLVPKPKEIKEYDYDENLARSTTNTYWSSGHILSKLQSSTVTDPKSGKSSSFGYTFDSRGNIESKTISGTGTRAYTVTYTPLDGYGRPTQMRDVNGNVTKYDYSNHWIDSTCSSGQAADAYLTGVTNAKQQITQYNYYSCTGDVASVIDPNNQTIAYHYDSIDRLTDTCTPDSVGTLWKGGSCDQGSGSTQVSYQDTAPSSITTTVYASPDPQRIETKRLDGFGRIETAENTNQATIETSYDAAGRVHSITNPHFSSSSDTDGTTYFSYDALDRKVAQVHPDGSTLQYCYNGIKIEDQAYCSDHIAGGSNQWMDVQDEMGNRWQLTTDVLGHLTSVIEPMSLRTDYEYDVFGNLTSVLQQGNSKAGEIPRTRSFIYDGLSRLTSATNPESGAVSYSYERANAVCSGSPTLVCSKTDARNITINYAYDSLNRLVAKVAGNDLIGKTSLSCFQYDSSSFADLGANLVGRMSNSWTQRASAGNCPAEPPKDGYLTLRSILQYDPMGRIRKEQQCVGSNCTSSSTPYSLAYDYDLAGSIHSYTNGLKSTAGIAPLFFVNSYDKAGELESITSSWQDPSHPSLIFSTPKSPAYNAAGALMNATYGSGLTVSRWYDNRLRIKGESDIGNIIAVPVPGSAVVKITGEEQVR